jgi:hypothetical protein
VKAPDLDSWRKLERLVEYLKSDWDHHWSWLLMRVKT